MISAEPQPAVVVLNLHYSGLAIARDLHQPDRQIVGLSSDAGFFGNVSRCVDFRLCPDTESQPDACLAFLTDLATQFDTPPLLLPTRDHDVHFIMRNRHALEERFLLRLPGNEILEAILDKSLLAKAASAAGIHCPASVEVSHADELESTAARLGFPCIMKPVVAAHWRRGPVREIVEHQKAIRVDDAATLRRLYEAVAAYEPRVTIQEFIQGPETNLVIFGSCCNAESEVIASFTARKRLQYPAQAGTGVAVEATPIDAIVDTSRRLLRSLGYVGISEIEYKHDAERDRFVLIEINTRHWDQHSLGTAVGVNLSEALYRDVAGLPTLTAEQAARSVLWVAEDGFLLSLLGNLKHRAYAWSEYLQILRGPKCLAVWRWRDPRPGLRLARSVIMDGLQRAGKLFRRTLARR